jgi:hypothetical protein
LTATVKLDAFTFALRGEMAALDGLLTDFTSTPSEMVSEPSPSVASLF